MKQQTIKLNNGTRIPIIGLGTWQATGEEVENAVLKAIKLGYRHIDTAKIYGNEEAIGRAIKKSGIKREDLFITTKLWLTDFMNPMKALDSSLKKLQMNYVDLYLLHFPVTALRIKAYNKLEEALKQGKIKALGVSNFTVKQLEQLLKSTKTVPAVNQVEFTPYLNQKELLNYCKKKGIIVEAYSPLTRGKRLNEPILVEIAKNYNKTTAQLLIRFCLQKGLVVLPKSITEKRIKENIDVFDFEIKEKDMKALDSLNEDARYCWNPTNVP